jgi:hypothetical protein
MGLGLEQRDLIRPYQGEALDRVTWETCVASSSTRMCGKVAVDEEHDGHLDARRVPHAFWKVPPSVASPVRTSTRVFERVTGREHFSARVDMHRTVRTRADAARSRRSRRTGSCGSHSVTSVHVVGYQVECTRSAAVR